MVQSKPCSELVFALTPGFGVSLQNGGERCERLELQVVLPMPVWVSLTAHLFSGGCELWLFARCCCLSVECFQHESRRCPPISSTRRAEFRVTFQSHRWEDRWINSKPHPMKRGATPISTTLGWILFPCITALLIQVAAQTFYYTLPISENSKLKISGSHWSISVSIYYSPVKTAIWILYI